MSIGNVAAVIEKCSNIAITFHKSPDGDSIGSALALFQGLCSIGKRACILSVEDIPEDFKFLPCSDKVDSSCFEPDDSVDCVVVLDCGDKKRINARLNFDNRNYKIINLDHHLTNENYGDLNYVDTKAAAVSELVYELLSELGVKIDKDMAECMYTSLITDTGSFKYSSTTPRTHSIAGKLIGIGFDFSKVHRTVFDNKSIEDVRLIGMAIDNMELINDNICIVKIKRSMLENPDIDTHDIVNVGLKVSNVEVSILLKESEDGKIKVSLRSKNFVDVRKIAEKFNGGGHIRAAGAELDSNDMDFAADIILREIQKEMV